MLPIVFSTLFIVWGLPQFRRVKTICPDHSSRPDIARKILWPIQAGYFVLQLQSCNRDHLGILILKEVESGQVIFNNFLNPVQAAQLLQKIILKQLSGKWQISFEW